MRRALLLGAVGLVLAAAAGYAFTTPFWPAAQASQAEPHITRLFIPAIKEDCRARAGIDDQDARFIGYTFTAAGALETIDRDGSLTGIDRDRLITFNACLSGYPIEPIQETPRNHYSRNLLYDYITTTLRPCLADRFDDLPPLPSRADFVVRLYVWDPYRYLAPRLNLQQLIDLSASCPEVPPYLVAG
jgi:hypothetical protein